MRSRSRSRTHTLDTRSESAVEVVLPFRMPKAENDVAYAGVAATAAVAEWVLGCMQRWLGCALARSTGRETETLSQQTGQVAWDLHKHTHTHRHFYQHKLGAHGNFVVSRKFLMNSPVSAAS